MVDDASIAVLSISVAIAVIARRQLADPQILRAAVEYQDCPTLGALIADLRGRGHRDRARGLLDQLAQIRAAGGWHSALQAAHPHARETWSAAAEIARGE